MKIVIYKGSIDFLNSSLLILPLYADEKPLKELAGFVDWRLHNFISHMMMNKIINYDGEEKILLFPKKNLPIERFLLTALRARNGMTKDYFKEYITEVITTVDKLKVYDFAIPFPRFISHEISLEEISTIFLKEIAKKRSKEEHEFNKIFLYIETKDELKDLALSLKGLDRKLPINMNVEIMNPEY